MHVISPVVAADPNNPPKSLDTTNALYWLGFVISADQMLTANVRIIDQKMIPHLPKRLESGDQMSGPMANPAMAAEICIPLVCYWYC